MPAEGKLPKLSVPKMYQSDAPIFLRDAKAIHILMDRGHLRQFWVAPARRLDEDAEKTLFHQSGIGLRPDMRLWFRPALDFSSFDSEVFFPSTPVTGDDIDLQPQPFLEHLYRHVTGRPRRRR